MATVIGTVAAAAVIALCALAWNWWIFPRYKVRYSVDAVPILNLNVSETSHLSFTLNAHEANVTNLAVTNVVYHRVEFWNEGTDPAEGGSIRISCYKPSVLVVKGENANPDRFGGLTFERTNENRTMISRLGHLNPDKRKGDHGNWWRNVTVAGPNTNIAVEIIGKGWEAKESK